MNVKSIFRNISKKMLLDFQVAGNLDHMGMRGAHREDTLKRFLEEGKLPDQYGVTSGIIINSSGEVSSQTDIIIYDRQKSPTFIQGNQTTVLPIEGIYGIIEVKSKLSRTELVDSLEKIARFKSMLYNFHVNSNIIGKFAIIFAYSSGVSDDSIIKTIDEFRTKVDNRFLPNMIVILGESLVTAHRKLDELPFSEDFDDETAFWGIHFKDLTLFQFYIRLQSLLSNTELGRFNFYHYDLNSEKLGDYYVSGHMMAFFGQEENGRMKRLYLEQIDNIYKHCQNIGKVRYQDMLEYRYGHVPPDFEHINPDKLCYFYNPSNLAVVPDVPALLKIIENNDRNSITFCYEIRINGELYVVPEFYFPESNLEDLPDLDPSDFGW